MQLLKILLLISILQFGASCSKPLHKPFLVGDWTVTSAVGNDGRHWTGTFTLEPDGNGYKGLFLWNAVDGQSTGTDSVTGTYDPQTKVLTMKSVVITGTIEPVTYTMNVTDNGTKMNGIWTGSSDGSIEDPGVWTAEKD